MPQPGQADDGAFGVLTRNGKLVVYHYSLIDTTQTYLKHLKTMRKVDEKEHKALYPNEKITPEEKLKRSNEDKAEASTYKNPFFVIKKVDTVDMI